MAPAAARKGPIQLHDEIWGIVISHLRVSLPTPNGKNDKSAILQVDLASAMRVNKVSTRSEVACKVEKELIYRSGTTMLGHCSTKQS